MLVRYLMFGDHIALLLAGFFFTVEADAGLNPRQLQGGTESQGATHAKANNTDTLDTLSFQPESRLADIINCSLPIQLRLQVLRLRCLIRDLSSVQIRNHDLASGGLGQCRSRPFNLYVHTAGYSERGRGLMTLHLCCKAVSL
jgi:hypothetical protein